MPGIKKRKFKFDKNSSRLFAGILELKSIKECEQFFRDLMTEAELQAITERFLVAQELYKSGKTYRQINQETGVSTATITRVSAWMEQGNEGYKTVLKRLAHHHK